MIFLYFAQKYNGKYDGAQISFKFYFQIPWYSMLACWIYCILLLMQTLAPCLGGWVFWEVRERHLRGTMVDMWPNTAKSHQHSTPISQYGAGNLSMQCCRWAIQVLYPSECAWVYFMPLIWGNRPPKYISVSEIHFMIAHANRKC